MKDNVVKDKSLEFAVRIVNLYKFLVNEQKEFVMSKQILRSGTSIGANIREAEQAQSRADFINKLNIALKEANETEYWLELLIRTEYITREQYESINNDSTEINKLLISIIKTTKKPGEVLLCQYFSRAFIPPCSAESAVLSRSSRS